MVVLGKTVVGSAFDVLSETASLALKGVSLLVPDAIEDPVKNTIKKESLKINSAFHLSFQISNCIFITSQLIV